MINDDKYLSDTDSEYESDDETEIFKAQFLTLDNDSFSPSEISLMNEILEDDSMDLT